MKPLQTWTVSALGQIIALCLLAAASQAHGQELAATELPRHGTVNWPTAQEGEVVSGAPDLRLDQNTTDELTLEQAREDRRHLGLGAPIVLMAVSLQVAVPLTLVGLLMNAVNDDARPLLGGLACAAVGVGAGVWLGHRVRARRLLSRRIRELEREGGQSAGVRVGLNVHPEHATFSLGMRF